MYFSFSFAREEVLFYLEQLTKGEGFDDQCVRVRLSLQKDGSLETSFQTCTAPLHRSLPETPVKSDETLPGISLSKQRIDSSSPWVFHKTSKRELFQEEFARAGKSGLFDIVFLNDRQELTEGCISNLIVLLDGKHYTPPVSSGLLSGTMRANLLASSSVTLSEKTLSYEDLQRAEALFCCNSVREVVQVCLR